VEIEGIVVDEHGHVVLHAWVRAKGPEARGVGADEGGRFVLTGLRPGKYKLSAETRGYETLRVIWVEAPVKGVRLVATRLGEVRMRLVHPDGKPFSGEVSLAGGDLHGTLRVADGQLRVQGFDGSLMRLCVQCEPYLPLEWELTVAPGEVRDLGTVVLDPGVTLTGRAVDPAGKPVPGAWVYQPGGSSAQVGPDGTFALGPVPRGRATLRAGADGYLKTELEVETGEGPVTLTIARGALVRGRVTDSSGRPLDGIWVELDSGRETDEMSRTEADGSFEMRVPPGRYRVRSTFEEDVELDVVDLKEGQTLERVFVHPGR
jgi:hypothetical protein